ncbi:hypothetical protein BB561_001082 [Smittium simulii]|uniref:Uncharacterized protein n=1 Tax=Smittium simulii TaxID=133385 RepID=A0A2T9YW67_9FUNG|nr:hypothetical protein BB561_001082 [Smittium simulii]
MFFDLKKYLVQYQISHNEEMNQILHTIFFPSVVWSIAAMLSLLGPIYDPPQWMIPFLQFIPEYTLDIHLGTVLVFTCFFFTFLMDPLICIIFIPAAFSQLIIIQLVTENFPYPLNMFGFMYTFVFSSSCDLIGHYYIEGNTPALFKKNYKLIPFYHFFTIYNFVMYMGYRPELYQDIKEEAAKEIERLNALAKQEKKD